MNRLQNRVKNASQTREFAPDRFGLWRGCDGQLYAPSARCRQCGKSRAEHLLSGVSSAKPEQNTVSALVEAPKIKESLLRVDGPCRVRITRGYGPAGPLDRDNLLGSLKKLRDEIAEKILGLSDDAESDSLQWEYVQSPGDGVLIEFFEDSI